MTPKVSVTIPTYNRAAQVRTAIESALSQTVGDLEVIVVDDGSSDNTGKVLRETYGDRIRYFAQTNQGVAAARNKGIREARGEWIAFLDSDDHWEKDKLEWQLKALERFGPQCGACYTDVQFLNHPEKRTMFQLGQESYRHEGEMGVSTEVMKLLVVPGGAGMVIAPSSFLARADVVGRTGPLDIKRRFHQDPEFMFRLAMITNFCYVNRPLVWFDRSPVEIRHVGVSKEWDKTGFILQDTQEWYEGILRLGEDVPWKIRKLIRDHLGSVHSGLVNCYLETGQYGKAREAASKAVQIHPSFNFAVKCFLTWISPGLALRTVRRHQEKKDSSAFV
jgi:glycosyltransferase involved in cell wall biosynthesis